LRFCRKVRFLGQNPKIECREFNDLQTAKLSKKQLCDRTNEAAIKSYNAEHGTAIAIRNIKYLNDIVAQDYRAVKRVTRPMLGLKSFEAAHDTLVGIKLMPMIKKRQLGGEEGEAGLTAAAPFDALAASSPHRPGQRPLHDLLSKICDTTKKAPYPLP
jgi:DDE domain